MPFLLDSDTCIGLLRGEPQVVQRFQRLSPADCAVSAITAYELYTGVEKCADPVKERAKIDLLLANVHTISFDAAAAKAAAVIRADLERRGQPIGPYDTLIAAPALALNLTLATSNISEFTRVVGLSVDDWRV